MVYVHVAPESDQDERQLFAWKILRQALERTRQSFGGYEIGEAPVSLQQRRQIQALTQGGRDIDVALLPVLPGIEESTVIPVRIPVAGGLWGYRVLLIREDRQERFDAVRDLADLRKLTIGQSWFWPDTEILRKADLTVVTGEAYEGLFKMLASGRFDAFSRGITEAETEYRAREKRLPELTIERHILLHYPMPEYFWFANDATGRRLARRVQEGLLAMVADHSLCRMVEESFGESLRSLDLDHRTLIELPNPLLGDADHLDDRSFWCDPLGYRSASQP